MRVNYLSAKDLKILLNNKVYLKNEKFYKKYLNLVANCRKIGYTKGRIFYLLDIDAVYKEIFKYILRRKMYEQN